MSDQQSGPGWWLASDGRWYPPDQAPPVPPQDLWAGPPPGPPPRSGMSTGAVVALVIGGVVALFVVLGAALALVGTESDSDTVSALGPAAVPEGFALIEGDGVSIAAPSTWREIDPDTIDSGMVAEAFPDVSADLPEDDVDASTQGVVLVAMDAPGPHFAENVNVVAAPLQVPLAELSGFARQQLEPFGAEISAIDRAHLPVGDAVRVTYTIPVALPDGSSVPIQGVQHYVPLDGRTYVITVSTSDDPGELADQMAATFRVT